MSNELTTMPTNGPAEIIDISPEGLEVANTYLQLQDINKVADELGITVELVTQQLSRREIKSYIDHVFMNLGFNNRFKMRSAMDSILSKKFKEMDDADIGSSKDIIELMALSHKMSMDELDRQIKLEELKTKNAPKSQVNVQINDQGGSNYGSLIERIINSNV